MRLYLFQSKVLAIITHSQPRSALILIFPDQAHLRFLRSHILSHCFIHPDTPNFNTVVQILPRTDSRQQLQPLPQLLLRFELLQVLLMVERTLLPCKCDQNA